MLIAEIQQDTRTGPVTLNPRWLRIPSAVKYSGLSRSRLYELLAQGRGATSLTAAGLGCAGGEWRQFNSPPTPSENGRVFARLNLAELEAAMGLDSLNKRAAGSSLLICLWPWRGNRAVDGYHTQVWVDSRSGADLAV